MRSVHVPAAVAGEAHVAAGAGTQVPTAGAPAETHVPAAPAETHVPAAPAETHVPAAPAARVRVLLFASYRDLAGTGELEVQVRVGDDVAAALDEARARAPGLERLPETPAVAVNGVYADLATPLADGDEIALLPPVAGG